MTAAIGAGIGLAVGVAGAVLLNIDLLGYVRDAGSRESARPMRWVARSLLVILPVALAFVGYTQADAVVGGLK